MPSSSHFTLPSPSFHQLFAVNQVGCDYVVGDIHGAFEKLREHLEAIGFNPIKDRLFSVGDLIDRNHGSTQALQWLQQPFFHCVRGNHEDMYLNWRKNPEYAVDYFQPWNGGEWVLDADSKFHTQLEKALIQLPYLMSIPLTDGTWVLIAHADLPKTPVPLRHGWIEQRLSRGLLLDEMVDDNETLREAITWNRQRIFDAKSGDADEDNSIDGYDLIVVGHTTLSEAMMLGRFAYLDTGGWIEKRPFSVRKLSTLIGATHKSMKTPSALTPLSKITDRA